MKDDDSHLWHVHVRGYPERYFDECTDRIVIRWVDTDTVGKADEKNLLMCQSIPLSRLPQANAIWEWVSMTSPFLYMSQDEMSRYPENIRSRFHILNEKRV